jgi:hypothetical protein
VREAKEDNEESLARADSDRYDDDLDTLKPLIHAALVRKERYIQATHRDVQARHRMP